MGNGCGLTFVAARHNVEDGVGLVHSWFSGRHSALLELQHTLRGERLLQDVRGHRRCCRSRAGEGSRIWGLMVRLLPELLHMPLSCWAEGLRLPQTLRLPMPFGRLHPMRDQGEIDDRASAGGAGVACGGVAGEGLQPWKRVGHCGPLRCPVLSSLLPWRVHRLQYLRLQVLAFIARVHRLQYLRLQVLSYIGNPHALSCWCVGFRNLQSYIGCWEVLR